MTKCFTGTSQKQGSKGPKTCKNVLNIIILLIGANVKHNQILCIPMERVSKKDKIRKKKGEREEVRKRGQG